MGAVPRGVAVPRGNILVPVGVRFPTPEGASWSVPSGQERETLMPTFEPPKIAETPAGGGRLFERYKLDRGVSVLIERGVVRLARYPSLDEILAADKHYLGGYVHTITDEEADVLRDAGLGEYITP